MMSNIILSTSIRTAERFEISADISEYYCVVFTFITHFYPHDIIESIFILCTSCIVLILQGSHFNPFFNEIVVSGCEIVC